MTSSPHLADRHERTNEQINEDIDVLTFRAARSQRPARIPGTPTFRMILACTDGSKEAERALDWARELGKTHNAHVIVASVFTPPHLDGSVVGSYGFYTGYVAAYADTERNLRDAAESGADVLRDAGIDAESVVTTGSPAHEIAEIAKTHNADLVILGSHNRNALGRVMMGSTVEALLDRVHASVLVARGQPRPARILAAIDGSHASSRAVAYAIREAEATKAEVVVQHVLHYPDQAKDVPAPGLLRDVVGRMRLQAPPRITYQLDAGRPAQCILAKAEEIDAGLIVVGSRGLGRVRGWLLGSVSRRVAANAPMSVLIVKDAHEREKR